MIDLNTPKIQLIEMMESLNQTLSSMHQTNAALVKKLKAYEAAKAEAPQTEGQPVWNYCPECGSEEYRQVYSGSPGQRCCLICEQSWWPDVNYTTAVKANLVKRHNEHQPTQTATHEDICKAAEYAAETMQIGLSDEAIKMRGANCAFFGAKIAIEYLQKQGFVIARPINNQTDGVVGGQT